MDTPQERFDETFMDFVNRIANADPTSAEFASAASSLKTFSECRPPSPEPEPDPIPDTRMGRLKAWLGRVWDNETTRTTIKSGGAFAGVLAVAYTTVHRDHVLERNAINQANQKPVQ